MHGSLIYRLELSSGFSATASANNPNGNRGHYRFKRCGWLRKKNACEQVEEPHSVAAAALKRNTIPLGRKKLGAASERAEKREL